MDFSQLTPPYAPSAWLDLAALDQNIERVNRLTKSVKLRIASKSVRSLDVLKYIQAKTPHFIGIMSYSAAESVYLLNNGFDNILCAYPSLDSESIAKTIEFVKHGATMIWMVDSLPQWQLIETLGRQHDTVLSVCLDINMSMPLPKLYFGTKRSSLMGIKEVQSLLEQTQDYAFSKVTAVMGYEGQIAGLPESLPQKSHLAPVIRGLKAASKLQLARRRKAVVAWLTGQGHDIHIVNGGGSGSMAFTTTQPEITEITIGSAYYYPALFGYMDSMQGFKRAAGFVLPVTRHPEPNVITCHGGGFVASGAGGVDKQPHIIYPHHLQILPDEGYGEVQTPLLASSQPVPKIGSYVWCQHAKAGELCEHFHELITYRDNQIVGSMTTYRAAGQCFH